MGKIDLSALKNLQAGPTPQPIEPVVEIAPEPITEEAPPAGITEIKKPKISLTAMNKPLPQVVLPPIPEIHTDTVSIKEASTTTEAPTSNVLKIGDDSYETLEILDKKKEEEAIELDRKKKEEVLKDLFPNLELLTQDFESDVFDEKNSAGLTEVFQPNPNIEKNTIEVKKETIEAEAQEDPVVFDEQKPITEEAPVEQEKINSTPPLEEISVEEAVVISPTEEAPVVFDEQKPITEEAPVEQEKKGFFQKNIIPIIVVLVTISAIVGIFVGMSLYKKHIEESSRVIVTQTGITTQEPPIATGAIIETPTITTEIINGISVTIRQNTKKNTGIKIKNLPLEVPVAQ